MEQVRLRENPQYRVVRHSCGRLLLLERHQLLCGLPPHLTRLNTLSGPSVHHLRARLQLPSPVSARRFPKAVSGQTRLHIKHQYYTPSHSHFCEDDLLKTHPFNPASTLWLVAVPGEAP